MESDDDSSSDDSVTSSGSSDDSSSQDEDHLEPARILGTTFELPQDLCENPEIFKEFLSQDTWDSLSEANIRHLKKFLPKFPENDEVEKEITVKKLFARETFKFTSPLTEFHNKLKDGAFRPDIARMQRVFQKAKHQHARHQWRQEWYQTLQEVLVSRERLLAVARGLPAGVQPRVAPPPPSLCTPTLPQPALHVRTKKRYFQELAHIRSEVCGDTGLVSEDENFPEGPPLPLTKNQKRNSIHLQNTETNGVVSTLGGSRTTGPHLSEEWRRRALAAHKRKKQLTPNHAELMTHGISMESIRAKCGAFLPNGVDPPAHVRQPPKRQRSRPAPPPKKVPASPTDSNSDIDPTSLHPLPPIASDYIKTEPGYMKPRGKCSPSPPPPPPQQPFAPPLTIKTEKVEEVSPPEDSSIELVQVTHVCFFSVLRDLVCGTPRQCLPLAAITAGLRKWRQNPIAPLNHWYSLVEDWVKALPSAVAFLAGEMPNLGEEFVPFLQYKAAQQVYQWIGAGRDSDNNLLQLCTQWLALRKAATSAPTTSSSNTNTTAPTQHTTQPMERPTSPPLTKWNAKWQVSQSELESFRMQERFRFQRPHKAFTYRLNSGNYIVAPLRGVYASDENDGKRGARGHSLLASGRPRHVTLLALVRDAVACLPGGEGTRAHITALLRRSQYLVPESPEQALQAAVSGALDRMHGAPDPCVRYLPMQKVWQYLHRDRSEEEFERLHAENQNKGKSGNTATQNKRSTPSKPRVRASKAKTTSAQTPPQPQPPTVTVIKPELNTSFDSDGDGEDANVDVEGTDAIPDTPQIPPPILIKPETIKQETPSKPKEPVSRQEPRLEIIGRHEHIGRHDIVAKSKEMAQRQDVQNVPKAVQQQEVKSDVSNRVEMAVVPQRIEAQPTRQVDPVGKLDMVKQQETVKIERSATPTKLLTQQSIVIQTSSQAPTSLLQSDKIISVASSPASTSILQARSTVVAPSVVRHNISSSGGISRSVVRVVNPTASGKSLISPQALKASTPPPATTPRPATSQAKVIVQRPTQGQTSGHQRVVLESLIQHQRSGQPVEQIYTVQPTQKVVTSTPGSTNQTTSPIKTPASSLGQTIQLAGQTVQLPSGQTVQLTGQTVQLTGQTVQLAGQTVQLGGQTVQLAGQTVQLGSGQTLQTLQLSNGQTVQLGTGQTVQLGSGQTVQLGGGQTVQLGNGQTVQLSGQTVQLANGQTVHLGSGQTVQLSNGQTVQLTSGQTVQLGNGQAVQLGSGQTVQLSGGQTVTRAGGVGPPVRQAAPLVAKILTNAQVRGGSIVQGGRGAGGAQGTLRVAGLSLAQLQGKPVLLHTSSTGGGNSNILLQGSGQAVASQNIIAAASPSPSGGGAGGDTVGGGVGGQQPQQRGTPVSSASPAPQHTLLLSNIVSSRGQVVRVASGGGHILGPTLRLQTAPPRPGPSNVVLGGQALKLQTSPIRLQSGAIAGQGGNRVLLASGTRLHGLKLLPVQHALARGGGMAGRQVYARIVGPGAQGAGQATIVRAAPPANVITTQPSSTTSQPPPQL